MNSLLILLQDACNCSKHLDELVLSLPAEFVTKYRGVLGTAQAMVLREMNAKLGVTIVDLPATSNPPETSPKDITTEPIVHEQEAVTPEWTPKEIPEEELESVEPFFTEGTRTYVEEAASSVENMEDSFKETSDVTESESSSVPVFEPVLEPVVEPINPVESVEPITPPTPVSTTPEPEPVMENPKEPIAVKVTDRSWVIPANKVMYQTQDVELLRGDNTDKIKITVSPLQVIQDGIVPVMVNAEYRSDYGSMQYYTSMSSLEAPLLTANVSKYNLLIKGQFDNGVFNATIMTTGTSIEQGDLLSISKVYPIVGTEAVPELELTNDATLWISFTENAFFGMLHLKSGDWLDEYNSSHDAMLVVEDDYQELHTRLNNGEWSIEF